MSWIQHPVKLEGSRVALLPLDRSHFDALTAIAKDEKIWTLMSINGADEAVIQQHLKTALLHRAAEEQYPFTIVDKEKNQVIGSTMLMNIFPEHKKLEIGWTWYDPAYWGSGHNTECKYLLLTHCFETMKAGRVQLVTNEHNIRSRTAIQKIGATYEGILRNDRVKSDGTYRNTAVFSIVDREWPKVKAKLEKLIK